MKHLQDKHSDIYNKQKKETGYYLIQLGSTQEKEPTQISVQRKQEDNPTHQTIKSNHTIIEPKNDDKETHWFNKDIDDQLIDQFIENELTEFIGSTDQSQFSLTTKQIHKQNIKYIENWKDLESLIDFAFENSNNWETFLENFKITIVHIETKLYAELYSHLDQNPKYKQIIQIFKRIKVWLKSIRSGILNHQYIIKLIEKMDKF